MTVSIQSLPLAAGQTEQVFGHSIDSFAATTGGTLTITGADGVARAYPVSVGPNQLAVPISQDMVDQGNGIVVSAGAVGVLAIVQGAAASLSPPPVPLTVAQLPAAATTAKGTRAIVSDSTLAYTTANVGTTVVGGNTNTAPVFNNGTNWIIG